MKKIINLSTGLYDNSILMLSKNDNLQIELKGNNYLNSNYYFKGKNKDKDFNLKFNKNLIEINSKDLTYGELKSKIIVMIGDEVIKEFYIENLIIKELDNKIKVIPQFEEYKEKFNTLIEKQNSLIKEVKENQQDLFEKYKKLEEFEKEISELKKLVYVLCNIGGE